MCFTVLGRQCSQYIHIKPIFNDLTIYICVFGSFKVNNSELPNAQTYGNLYYSCRRSERVVTGIESANNDQAVFENTDEGDTNLAVCEHNFFLGAY